MWFSRVPYAGGGQCCSNHSCNDGARPGKHINLKATYTNAFALRADKTTPPKAH